MLKEIPRGYKSFTNYWKYLRRFDKERLIKFVCREIKKVEKLEKRLDKEIKHSENLHKIIRLRDNEIERLANSLTKEKKEERLKHEIKRFKRKR